MPIGLHGIDPFSRTMEMAQQVIGGAMTGFHDFHYTHFKKEPLDLQDAQDTLLGGVPAAWKVAKSFYYQDENMLYRNVVKTAIGTSFYYSLFRGVNYYNYLRYKFGRTRTPYVPARWRDVSYGLNYVLRRVGSVILFYYILKWDVELAEENPDEYIRRYPNPGPN